jgi:hypothetical protein
MTEGQGWVDLADGDEFAGCRIERMLGRGGMGILYLAIESGLEPKPQPLTPAALIQRGDRICKRSQDTFKAIRNPVSETTPDVPYSEKLLGNL